MAYNTKKHSIGSKRHEEASDRSENMRNRKFMNFRISYVSQFFFQIDLKFFSITLKKKSENFQKNPKFCISRKTKKTMMFFENFENFQIFFQSDRKKTSDRFGIFLGHIGDAEIHELSIAHVFRAIGSLLETLKANSMFFVLYDIFLAYIDSIS